MRTCQNLSRRPHPTRTTGLAMRCWRSSSRSAGVACTSCSGAGGPRRSRDCGRCRAGPSGRASASARLWGGTWPPRSTSPRSRTWSSSRPAAIPSAIRGGGPWPRPISRWYPPTSSRASPRTPPGTPSRTCRRPRSTTGRSWSRGETAAGQAVLHQHRLRPGPRDLHDRPAAGHLRRLHRPPDLSHQPAADPDPARRDRGHAGRGPADRAGRPGHALPVRGPDPRDHQPVRGVPTAAGGRPRRGPREGPPRPARRAVRLTRLPGGHRGELLNVVPGPHLGDRGRVGRPGPADQHPELVQVAIDSSTGATWRHGPHHCAQYSMMTGLGFCKTSLSKVSSVTTLVALMAAVPSGVPDGPQASRRTRVRSQADCGPKPDAVRRPGRAKTERHGNVCC